MSIHQERDDAVHDMPAWPMPLAAVFIGSQILVIWLQSGGSGMESVWGAWGILGIMLAFLLIPTTSIFLVIYAITYFVQLTLRHQRKRRNGIM